jgi:hypothetical protein
MVWVFSRPWVEVVCAGVAALAVRLAFAPYALPLTADEHGYLLKAREIAAGDFTPIATHAIGWPLVLAPLLSAFPAAPIAEDMARVRMINAAVGALGVLPYFLLIRSALAPRARRLALWAYPFAGFSIVAATGGMAEPLFTGLLLATLACLVAARSDGRWIVGAGALAGLSWCVRPDGVVVVAIVAADLMLHRERVSGFRWRHAVAAVAVGILAIAPAGLQRYRAFGSPMAFGANGKYLVDEREQVWSANIAEPSLTDYIASHGPADYVDKFVVDGVGKVLAKGALIAVTPPLVPLFLYGVWTSRGHPRLRVIILAIVVWVAALSAVYDVMDSGRHLWPMVPLALVLSCAGASRAMDLLPRPRLSHALAVLAFAAGSLVVPGVALAEASRSPVHDGVRWGRWIAEHVRGRLAIVEGASLVMMHIGDTLAGGSGLMDLRAPLTGLSVVRPGYFASLEPALTWLRAQGVTHVAIDNANVARRPYLRALAAQPHAPYLRRLFSNQQTADRWKIEVFEIDWAEYDSLRAAEAQGVSSGVEGQGPRSGN